MIEPAGSADRARIEPTVAIVPVKGLDRAKSRLGERLSPTQRGTLVLRLLDHVLKTLAAAGVERRVVVSPDPSVRDHSRQLGAFALDDGDAAGPEGPIAHNRALERARSRIAAERPAALFVISADLPLLRPDDVRAIAALGAVEGTVVIAPDRATRGTNALFLRPPDGIPFCFGPESFAAHAQAARGRGLRVEVYRGVGTAFDVDLPADLDALGRPELLAARRAERAKSIP
jgi:2-phospho-L-lactate guanylyltransferase